jgi:chloride channel 2
MRVFKALNVMHPQHWIFLILVGLITAVIGYVVDEGAAKVHHLKLMICEEMELHWGVSYLVWIGITLFFTAIAASIGQFISKDAEGSGIPEMKSILAGVNIYRYLSFRTLLGKILGLFAGMSAGLSVGKEGPFVHIAAGIVNKLSKFKPFSDIQHNKALKKQMLAASVAAGVTATFGAPIGGVLLSIEVTSTYYMVSNLWRTFFCSCWSMFAFKILSVVGNVELFSPTKLVTLRLDYQYFAYAVLGVL